jgi:hypothetical protein
MGTTFASENSVQGIPSRRWFIATFVVYVALGLTLKTLVLNWIVGPLWLLVTLFLLPEAVRWIRRTVRARVDGSSVS